MYDVCKHCKLYTQLSNGTAGRSLRWLQKYKLFHFIKEEIIHKHYENKPTYRAMTSRSFEYLGGMKNKFRLLRYSQIRSALCAQSSVK